MRESVISQFIVVTLFCLAAPLFAQNGRDGRIIAPPKDYRPPVLIASDELQKVLSSAIENVLKANPSVKRSEIAATVVDLRQPERLLTANVGGDRQIYPASVVKLFYLAALERQIEEGKVTITNEMRRAERDMIVDSSNEATQYVLDVLTDTSSGAELAPADFARWQRKRNRVNRFYSSLGYRNINVNQKTFCEDAYGIEQQSRQYKGANRNMLTPDATARLMTEIVLGRIAGAESTRLMLDLLKRDPFAASTDPDSQARGFSGKIILDRNMSKARIWSKAGWTSTTRHDVAYIETDSGLKLVIAIFTENNANNRELIPSIVGRVIDGLNNI